jgi:hypothetical protein
VLVVGATTGETLAEASIWASCWLWSAPDGSKEGVMARQMPAGDTSFIASMVGRC